MMRDVTFQWIGACFPFPYQLLKPRSTIVSEEGRVPKPENDYARFGQIA